MRRAVIVDVVRSPFGRGRPGGALAALHPVDLYANVLNALVRRHPFMPSDFDVRDFNCGTYFPLCSAVTITGALANCSVEGKPVTLHLRFTYHLGPGEWSQDCSAVPGGEAKKAEDATQE